MSQPELLERVAQVLVRTGVPFMITGSLVSSMQGEPRSTHDVDVVVNLRPDAIQALELAFPEPDFYLDAESAREAIEASDMFNLIDLRSGDKVDFWMLTVDPFDQSRFGRRVLQSLLGLSLPVTTPEDTILQKLRWMRLSGGSEKQFRDAVSVYEVQFAKLDHRYLDEWARNLNLESELERLRNVAMPWEQPD